MTLTDIIEKFDLSDWNFKIETERYFLFIKKGYQLFFLKNGKHCSNEIKLIKDNSWQYTNDRYSTIFIGQCNNNDDLTNLFNLTLNVFNYESKI